MMKYILFSTLAVWFLVIVSCSQQKPSSLAAQPVSESHSVSSPLLDYVNTPDTTFRYTLRNTIPGDGYTTYILYMQSQRWLTKNEVKDPLWWHWLTIVVPDEIKSDIGLLLIGGGTREDKLPQGAGQLITQLATYTGTITAELHNVPNQPVKFVQDHYDPRVEDELIAYGWRKFLEGGARDKDAIWLARLPMTKAAVRAMDAVSGFAKQNLAREVNRYTVMGASKRGWTTWTTAIADDRVVAIAPVVIDMLNVIPSFQHHWQAYGFWAPAVDNYVDEGIMELQDSPEYARLMEITEPYSYRAEVDLPKFMINATGDQFFLPDSWQFYWNDLVGEKHLRYVANADHSLDGTDAAQSIAAFYKGVVEGNSRPDFNWSVSGNTLSVTTTARDVPDSIWLWQSENRESRDFRMETIGKTWTKKLVNLTDKGEYTFSVKSPEAGWKAFYAELIFPGDGEIPFKFTTGVVVVPDSLPYSKYVVSDK